MTKLPSYLKVTSFFEIIQKIISLMWAKKGEPDYQNLRLRVVISALLIFAASGLSLCVPITFKNLVTEVSLQSVTNVLMFSVAVYGITFMFYNMIWVLQQITLTKVIYRVAMKLQREAFSYLQKLSLEFHMEKRAGYLGNILSRVNQSASRVLLLIIFYASMIFIEIIGTTVVLWTLYGWRYGCVVLGMFAAYAYISTRIAIRFSRVQEISNNADNDVGGRTIDSLLNYQTVKSFTNENHECAQVESLLEQRVLRSTHKDIVMCKMFLWHGFLTGIGLLFLTGLAAYDIYSTGHQVNDFILINGYLLQLSAPLTWLGTVLGEVAETSNHLRQVLTILKANIDVKDLPSARTLQVLEGKVSFENITFSYKAGRRVLNKVSFVVPPGKHIAIVGSNGTGKSTLVNLLNRFFEPDKGRILIDDQDISKVTQASLRDALGLVPQDTILFNETILYNIRYGRMSATDAEVYDAARFVGLHESIMRMPDQYQTQVGERGMRMSGGERQRIAIARCVLKKSPILIFDEATSALDAETQTFVQQKLKMLAKGRTTITIAHRLATITDTDIILVFDQGKIVEQGTHKELLALNGFYTSLWNAQGGRRLSVVPKSQDNRFKSS